MTRKENQMKKDTYPPITDWRFDVGLNRGCIVIEPWASTIEDVKFTLTRPQMVKLRNAINKALREYPEPN